MIINLEKNTIFVTNKEQKPCVRASLNFEKMVDPTEFNSEVVIAPVYSIYVYGIDDTDEIKALYKEYYKQVVALMSVLYTGPVYYINTFESGEVINCLTDSIIETGKSPVKVPHKTALKIYRG